MFIIFDLVAFPLTLLWLLQPFVCFYIESVFDYLGLTYLVLFICHSLQVFANEKRRLKLTFRPDMVFAKPASADGIQVTGIILRVRQLRNRQTGEIKINTTAVGRVSRMYKFDGKVFSLCATVSFL